MVYQDQLTDYDDYESEHRFGKDKVNTVMAVFQFLADI
jgi:hypothetical protein